MIVNEAFIDELEKQAGPWTEVLKRTMGKALKAGKKVIDVKPIGPTGLQKQMKLIPEHLLSNAEKKVVQAIPAKATGPRNFMKSLNPRRMAANAVTNIKTFVKNPMLAIKADVANLTHKVNKAGDVVKRTYNPMKVEGLKSIGAAVTSPLTSSGFLGIGGMYGLSKALGEKHEGKNMLSAGAYTVAPGLSTAYELGSAALSTGKKIMKNKNKNNFYRPTGKGPVDQMKNNYAIQNNLGR